MKLGAGRAEISGRWVLFAALVLSTSAFAQPAPTQAGSLQAAGIRIGYVDMKRLIDNAPQFTEGKAQLEREFASRNETIKTDDAKLAALKQRYERDSTIMTHEDADALKREIDATERANKRMHDEARTELNSRAGALRDSAFTALQDTIIDYARAQGYDLIVPSPVLYANPRIDITDAILQRLKKGGTGVPKP
ncbi:MAG TPA: OmpH family outer membrane protein [Rudaea sp.]|uniref:OmpH family outer membrane protein n=1 Tax=Rudaea sp. TaxID=2136325 RepID=UPI002F9272A8